MVAMHKAHNKNTQIRLPPLTPLHTFVVSARFLSFTAAADYLCLTQGSVSRQIASLEESLGFNLFERHSKGLILSEKGAALLPGMQQAFELIKENIETVKSIKKPIKIHAPTCIMSWLMPKLASFRRCYPELVLEITTSVRHDLDKSSYDATITYGHSSTASVHNVLLFKEVLTPICQPEAYQHQYHEGLSLDQNLSRFCWLHATENRSDWLLWLNKAGCETIQPIEHQHFPTLDLTMTAAAQGLGMAMGDKTLILEAVDQGRLITPFELSVSTGSGYLFNYPDKADKNTEISLFVDWLLSS